MPAKKKPSTKPIPIDRMWFNIAVVRAGLKSHAEVARSLGLDRSAFSRTLKGDRRLQLDEVRKLASVLGVSQDEVLRHAGGSIPLPERLTASPVPATLSSIADSSPVAGSLDATTGLVRLVTILPAADIVALDIHGDEYLEGRRVLIDADITRPGSAAKDIGVLQLADGRMVVGKFKPGFTAGRFDVGPVLGFGTRLDDVAIVGLYELVGMVLEKV